MNHVSDYKCMSCGFIIIDHEKEYGKSFPESLECPTCKGTAKRIWKTNITIPENMKATHEG
jgi:DNA-directed RNA polymerase subunit RPC12/RpoP